MKKRWTFLLACLELLWICGCAPPGPRALLKGQRLIQEGKYDQAIVSLQEATRLLPRNAQAYNHLGLALHGGKQFGSARVAYLKALALDHKLAAAHYNLGCLLLEQNEAAAAIEHLTGFTLLQPNSSDGWLKLGLAQWRARQLDPAEKSLKTALSLRTRNLEVFNALGLIQLQRRRPQDALNYFSAALSQNPRYQPALLNAAIVNQQFFNNKQVALEKYRQYLAVQAHPANWETILAMANRLDAELNPPVTHLAAVPSAPPVVKTNPVPAQTNLAARAPSNSPPAFAAAPARTNVSPPSPVKTAAHTNQPSTSPQPNTNPFVLANIKPPPTEIPKPPLPQPPTHTNKPSELEVARVADELVVIPPQEITASAPTANPLDSAKTGSGSETDSLLNTKSDPKTDKRSILSRLNPFGGRPKSASKEKTEASLEGTSPGTSGGDGSSVIVAARSPSPPMAPRYTYVSPLRPSTGNRREAERFFNDGIKAQQAGKPALALAAYKKATQLDPSYFEAFYNQGLAAYALGNWKESLSDYEYALAIKPDSIDARYNFALALQQANYPQDASFELLEILNENPNETRAHLLLANLYARQLSESKLARQHYLKVLELDSRHPKAAEIRYWLAANP